MNTDDLPAPPPPAGTKPMTVSEIGENLVVHFMQTWNIGLDEARIRALAAIARMLDMNLLTEWGMDPSGEPLFVPHIPPQSMYIFAKEK